MSAFDDASDRAEGPSRVRLKGRGAAEDLDELVEPADRRPVHGSIDSLEHELTSLQREVRAMIGELEHVLRTDREGSDVDAQIADSATSPLRERIDVLTRLVGDVRNELAEARRRLDV